MQIDTLWLKNNFIRFNTQYFDGVFPLPRLRVGRSRTQLGIMSCKRKRSWGRTKLYDFAIGLSNYYDQTEHQFQSVLLHEMIHLSIAVSGVKDTSPHGVVFRGMMQRLNRDGWDIQVMTKTQNYTKAYTGSHTVIAQYIVLALEMTDGKRFEVYIKGETQPLLSCKWLNSQQLCFYESPFVHSDGSRQTLFTYMRRMSDKELKQWQSEANIIPSK